ncbi:hypothetical protein KIP88_33385 [Bradyrhizobium sp. SRL28]|uniref:hypothetical protein n=1 Tax=Bradyrhizobium sp. SRL28 TaxID=2836178 RepID=UPI001BDE6762|nr:hypothetical protein [Bradyrhizobium sp. SRL28]MBT1515388.1 hypothetical protein [Bradyrhizobium sp. SRL28]
MSETASLHGAAPFREDSGRARGVLITDSCRAVTGTFLRRFSLGATDLFLFHKGTFDFGSGGGI